MSSLESRRPSSFLAVTMLRLRRSWTSWRRKVTEARLRRALSRQTLLLLLLKEQRRRVAQLEDLLLDPAVQPRYLLPEVTERPAPTEAQLLEEPTVEMPQLVQRLTPGQPEPEPEDLTPPPPAEEQIGAALGWSLPRT